jgi:hypothetical protein
LIIPAGLEACLLPCTPYERANGVGVDVACYRPLLDAEGRRPSFSFDSSAFISRSTEYCTTMVLVLCFHVGSGRKMQVMEHFSGE